MSICYSLFKNNYKVSSFIVGMTFYKIIYGAHRSEVTLFWGGFGAFSKPIT
ncbi:hypothetical protein OAI61_01310 [bacterium]|nr:hypothetical protein [bacterium]